MRPATILSILAVTLRLSAQAPPPVQMGPDAARFFVYQGRPIHPFCVFFPFDSARLDPLKLSGCTNDQVVPQMAEHGWVEASTEKEEVRYRVLARKADRFLVASFIWGGGTGRFSLLSWLKLSEDQIVVSKPEMEGDRCSGGLQSDYQADGSAYSFAVNLTATDLVSLDPGVKIGDTVLSKLRYGAQDCDGEANYRYDVAAETMTLVSVSLNPPQGNSSTPVDACFDRVAGQSPRKTFTPEALREWIRVFAVQCGS